MHTVDANNDVDNGIFMMTSEMRRGSLLICSECKNLIREVESYVWDSKAGERGRDEPLKRDDHAIDALRYVVASHKISTYEPYKHNPNEYKDKRFRSNF